MAIVSVLGIKVEIDQGAADAKFAQLSASVEQIGNSFSKLGPKLKSVGTNLTTSITAPIVAIGGSLLKLSADFERAMNRVAAVTGSTGAEFKTLEQAALDMGLTSVYSAEQAAHALEELAKAGLEAPDAIAALPSVLDLATISGESLATTAVQMTDTLVQFGLKATDATRVADALAKAANASTIDVHDLGQSFKYSSIYASAFGMTVEETAAMTALFGKMGVKAEMAGTSLRNVIEQLVNPSKRMKDTMKELGVETWRTKEGTLNFVDILRTFAESTDPAGNAMDAFGKRAGPVMVKLVQDAIAGGTAYKEMMAQLEQSGVTAKGVADKMNQGLIGTLIRLKNIATTTGVEIGKELQPTFDKIVLGAEKLAHFIHDTLVPAFQALPQPVKDFLVYAAMFAAVLGPMTYVIGEYVTTIGGVVRMLSGTAVGMRAVALVTGLAADAWAGLGSVLAIALEPWFWIPALIAAAVGAVRYFTGSWAETIDLLSFGLLTLEDVVTAWELIKMGASALWGVLQQLGRVIWDEVLVPAGQLAVKLYELYRAFQGQIIQGAINLWNALATAITDVSQNAIGKLIVKVGELIVKIGGWGFLITAITTFYVLKAAIEGSIGIFTAFVTAVWKNVQIVGQLYDMVARFVMLLASEAMAVFDTLTGKVGTESSTAFQRLGQWVIWVADQITNVLLWAVEKLIEGLDSMASSIVKYVDFFGVIPAFQEFSAGVLKAGKDAFKFAKDTVAAARKAAQESIAAAQKAAAEIAKIVKTTGRGTAPIPTGTKTDTKEAERLAKLFDSLYGNEAIAKAQDAMKVFAMLPDKWRISEKAMAEYNETFYEGMEAMKRQGRTVPQEWVTNWLNTMEHAKFETHKILSDILDPKKLTPPNYWQWANQFVVSPIEQALAGMKWENALSPGLKAALRKIATDAELNKLMEDLLHGLSDLGAGLLSGLVKFEDGWKQMWRVLQNFTFGVFQGMFDNLTKQFQDWFKEALKNGNQFAGSLAGVLAGAVAGFTVGKATGKTGGILAGAAAGAAVGMKFGNYYGAAIGAVVGAFAGWWGGKQKEKEAQQAMQETREEIIKTFGGMEKLQETAARFGINIARAFETEDVEEFAWIVEGLQAALAKEEKQVKKLGDALTFTATQGALMSQELMQAIYEAPDASREGIFQFLQDQAQSAVAGLNAFLEKGRLSTLKSTNAISTSIVAMYGELIAQGVAPTEAFRQLQPALDAFNQKIIDAKGNLTVAGFEGSAAFNQLRVMAELAAGAVTGPVMDSMTGLQQAMVSVANLGLMNQDTFEGFGDSVYDAFKLLEAQGKGGEVALAGVQGPLQKLWELSTDFGYTLTEDQQKMVDFGLAAGTIGDKFRPAADRMVTAIDRLIDRLDRFITKMTGEMVDEAGKAAQGVEDALNNIDPDDIHQGYQLDPRAGSGGLPGGQATETALGTGGIVTHPTRALIGERGPEAVIPLPADLGGGDSTTIINLDGQQIARVVTKRQPGVFRSYGLAR